MDFVSLQQTERRVLSPGIARPNRIMKLLFLAEIFERKSSGSRLLGGRLWQLYYPDTASQDSCLYPGCDILDQPTVNFRLCHNRNV